VEKMVKLIESGT